MKTIALVAAFAAACGNAHAQTTAEAPVPSTRLVLICGINEATIVQGEYCGKRTSLIADEKKAYRIKGDRPTWLRVKTTINLPVGKNYCDDERTFRPDEAQTYIVRHVHDSGKNTCQREMFRSVAGANPERVRSLSFMDYSPSCLVQ